MNEVTKEEIKELIVNAPPAKMIEVDGVIKFKIREGVEPPKYMSKGAAGMDITAQGIISMHQAGGYNDSDLEAVKHSFNTQGFVNVAQGIRVLIDTGIQLADMSPELEIQIRSRSGLTLKTGFYVLNAPGTIDSDYRGTIGVILTHNNSYMTRLEKGERIAQMVVSKLAVPHITHVNEITETERGNKGFGSTGSK